MTNKTTDKMDARLTRRNLLTVLLAAPLATCVSLQRQPPAPTCGRGRSPDECAQFQKFRVERYNRNYQEPRLGSQDLF